MNWRTAFDLKGEYLPGKFFKKILNFESVKSDRLTSDFFIKVVCIIYLCVLQIEILNSSEISEIIQ